MVEREEMKVLKRLTQITLIALFMVMLLYSSLFEYQFGGVYASVGTNSPTANTGSWINPTNAYADDTNWAFSPSNTKAFIGYRSNTGTNTTSSPKDRDWDGLSWNSLENEMANAGSPVRWVRVAYCPLEARSTEKIVVTLSEDRYYDAYVWNGASWTVSNNIGYHTGTTLSYKCFDLAYEKTTGRALLVYSRGVATTNEIGYNIWTYGSGWGGEQLLNCAYTNGIVCWINLATCPATRSGTGDDNEIALLYLDAAVDVHGYVWTGSAWSLMGASACWDTGAAIYTEECIAVAYEQTTGQALFIWGDSVITDTYYRTWDGTTLSGNTLLDIAGWAALCNWLTLKADPASDDLFLTGIDAGLDLDTAYWSGSAWTVHTEHDAGVDSHAQRCADFAWESTGSKGLLVYGTTADYITYKTFTAPNTWAGPTSVEMGSGGTHPWVQLRTNPRNIAGDMKILGAVLEGTYFDLGGIRWDGTTFTKISVNTFSADTTTIAYECFEMEFENFSPTLQHEYSGYGFSIYAGTTITQVRVRLDVKATADDAIKLEVSSNGGTSYLATTYTSPALTTSEQTIWVNVTSWDTWTPAKLNTDQIWVRVTQVATGAQDTVLLDWIPIEVTYANSVPTNGTPSGTNWDDTDNSYAQRQWYQTVVVYTDLDGYADFDYVELYLQTGGAVVRAQFRYDEDTNAATTESGGTQWDLDTTAGNFVESGNTITVTWKFKPKWGATEESDLDFKLYCCDDEPSSDTDTIDVNFDVVTNLLVSTIECTNTNNPDRININTATQIDVTVRYANDPSSSTATTFYPPDAEFTSISVHDSAHTLKGTDSLIVDGVGNVAITSETTVQSMNYHAYINMADADYVDGDELSPTEAIISDRLQVQSYTVSDSRANINDNINIDATIWFDYDNTQCTTGTITINGYSASHQGSGVYRITRTSATVTSVTYNIVACSAESTYGITTVDQNSQSVSVIWDRIRIDSLGSLDGRIDVSTQGTYYSTASLEYDNHALGSGDSLTLGGYAFSWVAGNSRFEYSTTQSSVTAITINSFTSGNEATYGITVGNINSKTTTIIWDRIRIDTLNAVSSSIPVNTQGTWYVTATLEYDSHALGSGDSLTLSGYAFTWVSSNSRFEHNRTESSPTTITINAFTSGNEATFSITVGNINGQSQSIEWYAVGYNLNLHVMDWDLTDAISEATVYKDADTLTSNANGWANWTLVSGTVQIKVKYFGFWVNGTFSVTMDSDKTIDVRCRLYDVTITVQESIQSAYLVNANVTVFNSTSTYGNRIKTGITGNNGQVALTNLPNNTLTFTQYGKSDWSLVIGNITQLVNSQGQSITLTSNQNSLNSSSLYSIPIGIVVGIVVPLKGHSITKCLKRKKNKKKVR